MRRSAHDLRSWRTRATFLLGAASKIALGFSEALFPILLATAASTSQVEPRLVWSAAALGTPRGAALFKVVVPAAPR
jgi:NitT/TauT family transport system permease protein